MGRIQSIIGLDFEQAPKHNGQKFEHNLLDSTGVSLLPQGAVTNHK